MPCVFLQLAQDELDDRTVLLRLRNAMLTGGPSGTVAAVDLQSVRLDKLDSAITFCGRVGCKTLTASQMLATGQLVRRLRQALLDNDLKAAAALLDSVRGKSLASVASDEIQFVRNVVDNWLVITELTVAMSTGMARVRDDGTCRIACVC